MTEKIFDTDKRIKLGIWGLGRGGNFVSSAKFLNIDVVAGCDIHQEIREKFQKRVPEAFCTADEDEFLASDIDAVLVATYLPDHTRHVIKALEAGKHVMCEVTSFSTPADGVRLVEAVEKSGKVYNLLENYPFTKDNIYLKHLWEQGFFGDFMYGEFEYVHACRTLCYAYNTFPEFLPVSPGYHVHNWRAALNPHIYCTHSLGPAMQITGTRPVSVTAYPAPVRLPGYLSDTKGGLGAQMIQMDNGGIVRNLMGTSTNDYHRGMRLWGTRAAVENLSGELKMRLGRIGSAMPMVKMETKWDSLGELAEKAGHGGGDFWELYFFARQIFTGEPAPWNIYAACDVTMAGLMAIRSAKKGGIPMAIPDFRDPAQRELYRNDDEDLNDGFDPTRIFPDDHDPEITGNFTTLMANLYPRKTGGLDLFCCVIDAMKVYDVIADDADKLRIRNMANQLIRELPQISENCRKLKFIGDTYPDSLAGVMIKNLLNSLELEKINAPEATIAELKKWLLNL